MAYGPPGGTATPGTNYSSPLGGTQTVTFAPGVATETLTLIPTDDNQADGNQSVVEAIAGMTPNQRYTVSGGRSPTRSRRSRPRPGSRPTRTRPSSARPG
ncbi:hypothetical protein FRUB_03898 [Fimbriiglobus ruber]|uniref:Uncharacterized protein n=1 Tax=Fimbriiglobus ruber TaxID=1908690 RepID=A0A225DK30_9BACT|nr:hypothetical protein FRUB_03898 [Fimbriiglobus ruber]